MIVARRKNALLIGVLWLAAVAVVVLLMPESKDSFMLWFWPSISLLLMVLGLLVYLGSYMLLAGFNTMTEKERSAYDLEKVTSFTGASLVLLSYLFFLMWPAIVLFDGMALFWVMFVVFICGTFFMIAFLNSKRFKKNPQTK